MLKLKIRLIGNKLDNFTRGAIGDLENGEIYVCTHDMAELHGLTREQYKTQEEVEEIIGKEAMIWRID